MCGRYLFTESVQSEALAKIAAEIAEKYGVGAFAGGEIFPTNKAPVLVNSSGRMACELAAWGMPSPYRSGVLINARAESVETRRTFSESFARRRCAVPATGFFEWKKAEQAGGAKEKLLFSLPGDGAIYLGGIWHVQEGVPRFVILTTTANASMSPIHHRMPVLISPRSLEHWVFDLPFARSHLREEMPALRHEPA